MIGRAPEAPPVADDVSQAVQSERERIGRRVNGARIVALTAWIALSAALGLTGRAEWLLLIPALACWLGVALALLLAARTTLATRYVWLATPLLDVPMVGWLQSTFIEVSLRPQAVAIFTVAIVASLVFVSQLSFDWRGIAITLIGSVACAALVLARAGLPLPNLFAAVLLLGWAAAVAVFSSSRVRQLVTTITRDQHNREAELTALVDVRTRELADRNRHLAARSAEVEQALSSLAAAQAELVRVERLASVAALVQGIAHELNNPINYIAGNIPPLTRYVEFVTRVATQLADGTVRSPSQIAALVQLDPRLDLAFVARDLAALTDDIAEGARRAQLIVGDLQHLTEGAHRSFELVDFARLVQHSRALFAARVGPGVTLTFETGPLPPLRARAGQIEQLVVNLVDNALRAVGTSGRVEVSAAVEADAVVLTVRDDGCGMTEAVRRSACEPFFTTRIAGEGAGLGLAIVASIVEQHGGALAIDSASGHGTVVTARLPANADRATTADNPATANQVGVPRGSPDECRAPRG